MQTPRVLAGFLAASFGAYAASSSSTVTIQVSNRINASVGVQGRLELALSTSFQLEPWSYGLFSQVPHASALLNALLPQHTRLQVTSTSAPLTAPGVFRSSIAAGADSECRRAQLGYNFGSH